MAKGSVISVQRGKLGKMVGYRVTNSNDGDTQGWRERIFTINNPRTAAQASQRMRLPAAANFYRGLQELLNHSWQGVRYGGMSRQKFMSLAMSPSTIFIPFVPKGTTEFIPGEYPVSMGSVACPAIEKITSYEKGKPQDVNIVLAPSWQGSLYGPTETWGAYCQSLVAGSPYLRNGDEITFIRVMEINGQYIPQHSYVVLDSTSQELLADVIVAAEFTFGPNGSVFPVSGYEDGELLYENMPPIVAAAVIISRHPANNSVTWLRSSSKMVCTTEFKNRWMSNAAYLEAEPTYRNVVSNRTSDWILNQGENTHDSGTSGASGTGLRVENVPFKNGTSSIFAAAIIDGGAEYPVYAEVGGKRYFGFKSGNDVNFESLATIDDQTATGSNWLTVEEARTRMPRVNWNINVIPTEQPDEG